MSHRQSRRCRVVAAGLAAAVAVGACTNGSSATGGSEVDAVAEAADEAPPRDAHLVAGGWPDAAAWIAREAAQGRPTVVNIFASWCGPCRTEAPVLREAIAAYPDVAFLGIDHQDKREAGAAFLEEEQLDFDATIFDVGGDVAINVGSRGMPTTAFFDRRGRLVHTHTGVVTAPLLAERLAELGVGDGDG